MKKCDGLMLTKTNCFVYRKMCLNIKWMFLFFVCQLPTVYLVDRGNFKTCDQSSFCR